MPQISKRLLNQKTQDKIFNLFITTLIKCNSKDLTISLVEDLFTPTEKVMFAKRISIAYMLLEDYDYRTISQILKVSTTTVGSVSAWLKIKGAGLRRIIKKIKNDEAFKKTIDDVKDAFQELIADAPGQNWSTSKKILSQTRYQRKQPF